VPPLDYDAVYALKQRHRGFWIAVNGGRAAYQTPFRLAAVDREIAVLRAPTAIPIR
jgi:hypothetical protein